MLGLRNLVKDRLRRGEQTVGAWITIPCPDVPEALSTLGFDWFVFDTEHALWMSRSLRTS